MSSGSFDRSQPPRTGSAKATHLPEFHTLDLDTGLTIIAARYPRAPLISLHLVTRAGAIEDSREHPGLASFVAALLDDGAGRRTGPELAALVERLGGSLTSAGDWDAAYVSLGLLASESEIGLELLSSIAREPLFPTDEIELNRGRRIAELSRRRDRPGNLAEDALMAVLYPESTYATPLLGTLDSLQTLTDQEIRSFHRERYFPSDTILMAIGDLDTASITEQAAKAFAVWKQEGVAEASGIELKPRDQTSEVFLIDRPQAAQTELRVGAPDVPANHPDRDALRLLNAALGGRFSSRLNLNLRERHGFTYGAFSRFSERLGPGPFVVSTAVANEVAAAATREVLTELTRICSEPLEQGELDESRDYLVGSFPYTLQKIDGFAARLNHLALHRFPLDYFARYAERLEELTAADLLAVAAGHLDPESMAVVAVGPAKQITPQFEKQGFEVHLTRNGQ